MRKTSFATVACLFGAFLVAGCAGDAVTVPMTPDAGFNGGAGFGGAGLDGVTGGAYGRTVTVV